MRNICICSKCLFSRKTFAFVQKTLAFARKTFAFAQKTLAFARETFSSAQNVCSLAKVLRANTKALKYTFPSHLIALPSPCPYRGSIQNRSGVSNQLDVGNLLAKCLQQVKHFLQWLFIKLCNFYTLCSSVRRRLELWFALTVIDVWHGTSCENSVCKHTVPSFAHFC